MEEEVEVEEVEAGGIAHSCASPFRSWISFQSCISASGDGGDTAAYESEFGCSQDASIITESGTGRGGEIGLGGVTEGVEDEEDGDEDEVGVAMREAQLFFFLLAALGWQAMEGDPAAYKTEFGCTL
jgi:hypothetical protein